jgi:hypothetical protein
MEEPKLAVGDAGYGTIPNIVGFEKRGIKAYLAISDLSHRTKYYPAKLFQYDSENDHYICPQGKIPPRNSRRKTEQVILYKPKAEVCNACPVKSECTGSKSGRHIFRWFFQEYFDRAKAYQRTEAYQKAMRKRSVWVEPLFGEAKEFHRLRRFRLRRLLKVNIEGVMVAGGQNLKRLIKHKLSIFFFSQNKISEIEVQPITDFFNNLIDFVSNTKVHIIVINMQNLQNFYPRRKRTAYYEILPLQVQILLRRRTHVASYGVFCEE